MNITSAQYSNGIDGNVVNVKAVIDGETVFVPLDPANRHYAEILKQVQEGTLTIQDAE